MGPNNNRTNLPSTKNASDASVEVKGIDSAKKDATALEDSLFIIKPPEKKPLNKKAIAGVISLTFLAVIMLITVLIFALIASASNLANDYRRLAYIQVKRVDKSLDALEPTSLLNKRNLDAPLMAISLSEQSQPHLENVLFIGSWSDAYLKTAKLEDVVKKHYHAIHDYSRDIEKLITFDDTLQEIATEEAQIGTTINAADSLSIRSVSGSYEQLAKRIDDQSVSVQAKKMKTDLVKIYHDKAGTYLAWAKAIEASDSIAQTQAQQELVLETAKVAPLTDDQNYIKLFTPTYEKLQRQQQYIEQQLHS